MCYNNGINIFYRKNVMYYKVKDVSKLLGVSVPTIINWCNQGKLKCMRTLTNHRLFDKDYINGLVEEMKRNG